MRNIEEIEFDELKVKVGNDEFKVKNWRWFMKFLEIGGYIYVASVFVCLFMYLFCDLRRFYLVWTNIVFFVLCMIGLWFLDKREKSGSFRFTCCLFFFENTFVKCATYLDSYEEDFIMFAILYCICTALFAFCALKLCKIMPLKPYCIVSCISSLFSLVMFYFCFNYAYLHLFIDAYAVWLLVDSVKKTGLVN